MRKEPAIGARFTNLVVQSKLSVGWRCVCDCGAIVDVEGTRLRTGHKTSCGCQLSKKTHGLSRTPTYKSWTGMIQRCTNPDYPFYANYGGRGITVCDRWLKFENFLADMGLRPEGKTIDRKDNDQGYCKENCRWATDKEQMNNRRMRRLKVLYNGVPTLVADVAKSEGVAYNTIHSRIARGKYVRAE